MKRPIRTKTAVLLVAALTAAAPAHAGILEIVVGVTPSCPEGFMGCWGEISQALRMLEEVESVAINPDVYNATASVHLRGDRLPDPDRWREQFYKMLGERIGFRGVEVTVEGSLSTEGGSLLLSLSESPQPLRLAVLQNKLQWNFKKKRPRGIEEEEARSYEELIEVAEKAPFKPLIVHVTGPLRVSDGSLVLEVREFFVVEPQHLSGATTTHGHYRDCISKCLFTPEHQELLSGSVETANVIIPR
jgi:hypothetical protein